MTVGLGGWGVVVMWEMLHDVHGEGEGGMRVRGGCKMEDADGRKNKRHSGDHTAALSLPNSVVHLSWPQDRQLRYRECKESSWHRVGSAKNAACYVLP